uniref:NADH dehydrogenase subunit 6 n=1 Tax=Rhinebothriidae sp. DJM-2021 TaxID=2899516 RepID=A0A8K1SWY5_9CEST|nr:NADH dehydrogenase subunit 6 [Rhinebothriidae sp. DJM-2021]
MIFTLSFFLYFSCLMLFSLVSHPVYYCILLVINSLICSFICYTVFGFSWYALLFCLVYIGGVYILFIFVSVHSPNSNALSYWSLTGGTSLLVFLCLIVGGGLISYSLTSIEFSGYLCSISEGYFYVCMCLTLLFGFFILSLIMSVKVNHYR